MITTALNQDPVTVRSLREWATFSPLFALGVVMLLILHALLQGSVVQVGFVSGVTLAFTVVWFLAFWKRARWPRTAQFVRFLSPLLLYPLFYTRIHAMMTAARPSDLFLVDHALAAIDRALFGVNPIAWLGQHQIPVLTDILFLCYFSYYLGMPVLLVLMFRSSDIRDFRRVLSAMTVGWFGALVTYLLFPALGPGRWMTDQLPALHGLLPTTEWIKGFLAMNLDPNVRDCIPSMHTGVTLLTLVYGFQYQRRHFTLFLLPGLGIILATMYIQAHYVIDVMLGIIAAAMIYVATEKLNPQ
jgi:hypothetical protein